jgi:hypothetical protein
MVGRANSSSDCGFEGDEGEDGSDFMAPMLAESHVFQSIVLAVEPSR